MRLMLREAQSSFNLAHQFPHLVLREAQSSFHPLSYHPVAHIKGTMSNMINPPIFYCLKASRVLLPQHGAVIAKTRLALRQHANDVLNMFNGDHTVDWVVM